MVIRSKWMEIFEWAASVLMVLSFASFFIIQYVVPDQHQLAAAVCSRIFIGGVAAKFIAICIESYIKLRR